MIGYLKTEKKTIEYDITFCQRKSLAIRLDENGNVFVRAPKGLDRRRIDKILSEKANWILTNQNTLQKLNNEREEKQYISGTIIFYKGHQYTLHIHKVLIKKEEKIIIHEDNENGLKMYLKSLEQEYVKKSLEVWYKEEARKVLIDKSKFFGRFFGKTYGNIRIKTMKTRWGSCSAKGNLNFNWKIIMAPEEVIDYLVVHELSHLIEMNHSVNFYKQLERVLPDYKISRKWLKENGKYLEL